MASIAVVLVLAMGGLAAAVSTPAAGQAQEDGLRYAAGPAVDQARQVESGITRRAGTAETLPRTLGAAVVDPCGDRAQADEVQRRLLAVARGHRGRAGHRLDRAGRGGGVHRERDTEQEAAQARSAAEGLAGITAELSRLVGQFEV